MKKFKILISILLIMTISLSQYFFLDSKSNTYYTFTAISENPTITKGKAIVLIPSPSGYIPSNDTVMLVKKILRYRLESIGYLTTIVNYNKANQFVINLPYTTGKDNKIKSDIQNVLDVGLFTFQEVDERSKDKNGNYLQLGIICLQNQHIQDVRIIKKQDASLGLMIEYNSAGNMIIKDVIKRLNGKKMAIFFDSRMLSAFTVKPDIDSGRAMISGFRNADEINKIYNILKSGCLPFKLTVKS